MTQEKRKRSRVPVHFDVGVAIGGETIKVQLVNISMNGMLCTPHKAFRADAACKVILSLGSDLTITIDATILRKDPRETAIHFAAMDEESFIHLRKIVEYNSSDADRIEREFGKKAFDK